MNDLFSALILAVVQGIAEWLPISSSAHLVLVSKLLGFDNSILFDLALHFGTLMAVFVYFGKDIVDIVRDLLRFRFSTPPGRLGMLLAIATLPAVIVGYLLRNFVAGTVDNLGLLALGLGITSAVVFIGSLRVSRQRSLVQLSVWGALLVGCAQVFSLFRGISRSGSTITTGLLLGLHEKEAVKFSFLLSIPIVFGANIATIGNQLLPTELLWATLVAFGVGLCGIHFSFTRILNNRKNLRWIALYVAVLAIGVGVYSVLG